MNPSRKLLCLSIGLVFCIGLLALGYYQDWQDWPGMGGFVLMLVIPDLVVAGILWLSAPAGADNKEANHA